MDEPLYKKIKLALERPYKDEDGIPIPVLLDINPDGEHIYESKQPPSQLLGENLRRIFLERGIDFLDRNNGNIIQDGQLVAGNAAEDLNNVTKEDSDAKNSIMTTEELFKLRMEILPQLFTALGEITQAKELLNTMLPTATGTSLILDAVNPTEPRPSASSILASTFVIKPPPIVSVEAFNAQLVIGSKDETLRKAASIFKDAAERMEKGRIQSENYWIDALKIRRENWGLVPAPLPFGSAIGKGHDKITKDFVISYGLEESPPMFRRRAVAHMATDDKIADGLMFPFRQNVRLILTLTHRDALGVSSATNTVSPQTSQSLDDELKSAQAEIVEQEIFTLLVSEAANLPSVSAQVSERLIVLEAAQGTELKFELVDREQTHAQGSSADEPLLSARCDIIFYILHALLLRRHRHLKSRRLGTEGVYRPPPLQKPNDASQTPPILQPIIDLLQYEVFCRRVKSEIDGMIKALEKTGISSSLRFNAVGEIGIDLMRFLSESDRRPYGGEAVLRLDNRHTVRLTFMAPSTLRAHLSQATLSISSIPQLHQLLVDEIERYILQRICDLGRKLSISLGGVWFVDLNRCVGRWEGSVLNFRIFHDEKAQIGCSVFRLDRSVAQKGETETFPADGEASLFAWVEGVVQNALR